MTVYNPQPIVTIGSVDYTSDTINEVKIIAGRITTEDQPRAGYCTVSLLVLDDTYPAIELNELLRVSIVDSNGVDPHIFSGYVTDISRRIQAAGDVSTVTFIDIIAAGPLARLSKLESEATYSKQYDGDRITAILQDVFTTSWDEVTPTTLTWAGVDPTKTWQTYDQGYVGSVETPGDYELYAYSGGAVEALSLCRLSANSALGILYETGDGLINYDSATTRVDRVSANGFTDLDAGYLDARSIAAESKISDLINQIRITYKANASETGSNVDSIAAYGLFAASRATYLEQSAQVQQQLDFFLETRSLPRINLAAVTVPLHNPNLPDVTRDALIGVFCGFPINVTDLPASIAQDTFDGFVEGYSWRITRYTADLTMTISDYALTAIQQAWQQVDPAETWQTITATLEWQDARVVA